MVKELLMGKIKPAIGKHRHRMINKYGVVECFGAWHPVDAVHNKESTKEAHDFSVELDRLGLRAMKEKIWNDIKH
jgi:hypothetical protein